MLPAKPPLAQNTEPQHAEAKLSCMPSMQNVISAHNKTILAKQPQTNTTDASKECNCRQNVSCPLSGKCLTESVVYQATVMREDTN